MAQLDPSQAVHLDMLARRLAAAGHGEKGALVAEAAAHLGVTTGTVHRWLKEHLRVDTGRKRRSDAGRTEATDAELRLISAALLGSYRKNGTKRIGTFEDMLEMLRANGEISTLLTASRISTLLLARGLHPDQLTRPEPATEQRSLHPNHVWQVDASVCTAYYLSNATGLRVMDAEKFYKNKPANVSRIAHERLIRYLVADHYTHELAGRYYLGSESAANLTDFLVWAFAPKPGHILHGVPLILQTDMGSANISQAARNFLARMQVRLMVHERHNSRANGSVEKGHDLWETHFESALRFARVQGLEDLNEKAVAFANHFGATREHSRYGKTRHALWQTITADQLRLAPPVEVMRELVTTHPAKRRVSNNLTISYAVPGHGKADFDLRFVPGVMAGSHVEVVCNPFRLPAVDVAFTDTETGEICWMTVEPVQRGEHGWRLDAPVIGQDLRRGPRGTLDHNRDAVMQLAYGGTTREEADRAKEAGALVFNGRVDPFKRVADAELPAYLRKRGTDLQAPRRAVELPRLNVVEACKRLRAALGTHYGPEVYAWVDTRFGAQGVPEDQIDAIAAQFKPQAPTQPAASTGGLKAVGGKE